MQQNPPLQNLKLYTTLSTGHNITHRLPPLWVVEAPPLPSGVPLFDSGPNPNAPQGESAQAWSVAELIRHFWDL